MNSKAIIMREYGGPEVLVAEDLVVGEPLGHELLIRQTVLALITMMSMCVLACIKR